MAIETYLLYVLAFGGWGMALKRDGGIGVGFRFLYAMHMSMFFLVGPLLGAISGFDEVRYRGISIEDGVRVALYGLLAYLATAYWLFPRLSHRLLLTPAQLRQRLAQPLRLESQFRLAWTLIGLGLLSLPLVSRTQQIVTLGAVLGQTTFLFDTGVAMLCLYSAAGGPRPWYYLGGPLFVVRGAVYAAASGHSGALFIHSLVFACIYAFAFKATAKRLSFILALAVLIMIPASMWLSGRDRLRESVKRGASFSDRLSRFVEIFSNPPPIDAKRMLDAYRDRGDFSQLMAAAVNFTPEVQPYALGDTFLHAGYAVVPRILWPNKPIRAGGNEFVSRYTGVTFDDETSVGMGHIFEFYVNFGVAGVVVGMAFMGALMAWMESVYSRRGVANLGVEFTLLFVNWTISFYADRSTMVAMTVIPALVLCVLIRWLVSKCVQWPYFNLPMAVRPVARPPSIR